MTNSVFHLDLNKDTEERPLRIVVELTPEEKRRAIQKYREEHPIYDQFMNWYLPGICKHYEKIMEGRRC